MSGGAGPRGSSRTRASCGNPRRWDLPKASEVQAPVSALHPSQPPKRIPARPGDAPGPGQAAPGSAAGEQPEPPAGQNPGQRRPPPPPPGLPSDRRPVPGPLGGSALRGCGARPVGSRAVGRWPQFAPDSGKPAQVNSGRALSAPRPRSPLPPRRPPQAFPRPAAPQGLPKGPGARPRGHQPRAGLAAPGPSAPPRPTPFSRSPAAASPLRAKQRLNKRPSE